MGKIKKPFLSATAVAVAVVFGVQCFAEEADLHLAAAQGDLRWAQHALDSGIYVDAANRNGFTLLHEAANEGHADIARVLLEAWCKRERRGKRRRNSGNRISRVRAETGSYTRTLETDIGIPFSAGFAPVLMPCLAERQPHNQRKWDAPLSGLIPLGRGSGHGFFFRIRPHWLDAAPR